MDWISSNLQFRFGWEGNRNRDLVIDSTAVMKRRIHRRGDSIIQYCSRRERRRGNPVVREIIFEEEEEEKKQGSSLGSVILCFYIWIKSIQMTTSENKRSIQTTTDIHKEAMAVSAMPKEIIQEEFLIRLPVKTLTRFKFLSKDCKDFISDGYFSGHYGSLQQFNGSTPIGFIFSNNTDNYAANTLEKHVFCVGNKFPYTLEKHVFGGANKFPYTLEKHVFGGANKFPYTLEKHVFGVANKFPYTLEKHVFGVAKRFGGYVITASKGLLLVGHNPKTLSVYDLFSKKKHVNLPRNKIEAVVNVSLGFKCKERKREYGDHYFSYNVEIYSSSETGTWQKSFTIQVGDMQSYDVFKVFHWHQLLYDPTALQLTSTLDDRLYGNMSEFEGMKDSPLQYIITIKDLVINVWILMKKTSTSISYMDEAIVCKSEWSLASSVSLRDYRVGDIYRPSRNLIFYTREILERIDRESRIHCSRRERRGNSRVREIIEQRSYCSLGSVILCFYIWKRSIQMTCVHKEVMAVSSYKDLLPNEIIEEEVLIRLPVKTLMRFKCVSKDWNDFISDDHFRRRYRSLQQVSGFICGNIDDDGPLGTQLCVANKFLYTSENNVEKEELESLKYLKKTFGYVLAVSKGLLLVGHNSKSLCVYDLVTKKHVNLPRHNLVRVFHVALGFKCEERSSSSNHHLCSYKVVCVDGFSFVRRNNYYSYDLEIYSSESGTWKKGVMKSLFPFRMNSRDQLYKVIGGVFHWLQNWFDFIVAYDSDDPTERVVLIQVPSKSNDRLQGKKILSHYEGTKDGSLQYIAIKDMVINVWILSKKSTSGQRSINYMDEDVVYKSEWSLASSVSIFDIGVRVGQKQPRIIGADPADAQIIYLEVSNKLYAYNHCERKGRFIISENILSEKDVFFIHFEWPTWPFL